MYPLYYCRSYPKAGDRREFITNRVDRAAKWTYGEHRLRGEKVRVTVRFRDGRYAWSGMNPNPSRSRWAPGGGWRIRKYEQWISGIRIIARARENPR